MTVLQDLNWWAILSLGLVQFGSFAMLRTARSLAFPVAVLLYFLVGSFAVLVKVLVPSVDSRIFTVSLAALVAVLGFLYGLPALRGAIMGSFGSAIGAVLLFAISHCVSRIGGFASIGFGDGQQILSIALGLQSGNYINSGEVASLKRGFGLAAIQSLGLEGEYLVGFLPLVFLAALVGTYAVLASVVHNKYFVNIFFSATVIVLLSTESVSRHIYLLNTHSLTWVVFAVLLTSLLRFVNCSQDRSTWLTVCIGFAAASMMRADNLLILAPTLLIFMWVAKGEVRVRKIAFWLALIVPFVAWGATVGAGPSVLNVFGYPALVVLALTTPLLVIRVMDKPWASDKIVQWFAKGILVGTLVLAFALSSSAWASIVNMFINLFLGEGLWGATPLFLVLLYVALILFDRGPVSQQQKWIFALVAGTMGAMILAKFGDGLSSSGTLGSFARIGWGDSLNRMLVYLIPGIVALLILRAERVWNRFQGKSKR